MPKQSPKRYHNARIDRLAQEIQLEWADLSGMYPDSKQLLHQKLDPGAIYRLAQLAATAILKCPKIRVTFHRRKTST